MRKKRTSRLLSALLAGSMILGMTPKFVLAAPVPGVDNGAINEFDGTLIPGEQYWFDVSEIFNTVPGNKVMVWTNGYWYPFTYMGTVNAYNLQNESETGSSVSPTNRSLLLADYSFKRNVSWDELNNLQLIFGKDYSSNGVEYTLRAPSGGTAQNSPANNEWDQMIAQNIIFHQGISGRQGKIRNWDTGYIGAFGQDIFNGGNDVAVRGKMGNWSGPDNGFYHVPKNAKNEGYSPSLGYRPVLEIKGTQSSGDLKVITLNMTGFRFGMDDMRNDNRPESKPENVNLIVKADRDTLTIPLLQENPNISITNKDNQQHGILLPNGKSMSAFKWKTDQGNYYDYDNNDRIAFPIAGVTTLTAVWGDSDPLTASGTYTKDNGTTVTVNTGDGTITGGHNGAVALDANESATATTTTGQDRDVTGGATIEGDGTVKVTAQNGQVEFDLNGKTVVVQGGASADTTNPTTVSPDGSITLDAGDSATIAVDNTKVIGPASITADGAITAQPGGKIVVPGGDATLDGTNDVTATVVSGSATVDDQGNIQVLANSVVTIDPSNTKVTGAATIAPNGTVTVAPGSNGNIILPGSDNNISDADNITVVPIDAPGLTMDAQGIITVDDGKTVGLPNGTQVNGQATIHPNGNIEVQGNGTIMTLDKNDQSIVITPTNGTMTVDKDGKITVPASPGEATLPGGVTATDVTIGLDGEITFQSGGTLTLPGGIGGQPLAVTHESGNKLKVAANGNIVVPLGGVAMVDGRKVQGEAIVSPEGRVTIKRPDSVITLPGTDGLLTGENVTVTPVDTDSNVTVKDGNVNVPNTDTVLLAPSQAKVTGDASIAMNGNVTVNDNGQIVLPGQDNAAGGDDNVTVKPTAGNTVTMDMSGNVTVAPDSEATVGSDTSNVTVRDVTINKDGTIRLKNSSTITLPGNNNEQLIVTATTDTSVTADKDGNLTVDTDEQVTIAPNTVVTGVAVIKPTGEVAIPSTGKVTVPGTNPSIHVMPITGTVTVEANGDVTVPENGRAMLSNGTEVEGMVTVHADGSVTADENGKITLPGENDGATGDEIKVTPDNGTTVTMDARGTVTVPYPGSVTLSNGTKVFGKATIDRNGNVSVQGDGKVTVPGKIADNPDDDVAITGDVTVKQDGSVTAGAGGATLAGKVQATNATIAKNGEITLDPGGALTLPGKNGETLEITQNSAPKMIVDANGDITVPAGGTVTIDPDRVVTGEAVIKPDGTVTFKSGSQIVVNGNGANLTVTPESGTTPNVTMRKDGSMLLSDNDKVTLSNGAKVEGVAVISADGSVTAGADGKLTLPGGNNGTIEVTPDGQTQVTMDATGKVTVPDPGSVTLSNGTQVIGQATINPDGTVEVTGDNGKVTVLDKNNAPVTVKPAAGSTVKVDKNGAVTVPAAPDAAALPGGVQVTDATIAPNGEITFTNDGKLTLPGVPGENQPVQVTHKSGDKLKVDANGDITVPAGGTAVIDPNTVVTGEAIITPTGEVETKTGGQVTLPGATGNANDDITVKSDAGTKVTVKPNGDVTVPEDGTVTLPGGTKVTGLATIDQNGNIAVQGNGAITVPDKNNAPVTVKPAAGSTVTVDKDGKVTVDGATLAGKVQATNATIAKDGEITLNPDGKLTLPGANGEEVKVKHQGGPNLKVDKDGNVTVPTGSTAVIDPNTVVTGEAIITPTGEVQTKPGSAITLPGTNGEPVEVKPDANTNLTTKPNGDVIVPTGGNATLSNGTKVSGEATIKPDGNVAVKKDGEITLPGANGNNPVVVKPVGTDNVTMAPDGTVTVPTTSDKVLIGGKTEVSGAATINRDGTVAVQPNGQITLPGTNNAAGDDNDVRVSIGGDKPVTIDPATGNLIVLEGGKVKVDPDTEVTGAATIKLDGTIEVSSTGQITLPGADNTDPKDDIKVKPVDGSTVTMDPNSGTITVPANNKATLDPNMQVTGLAVIDKNGNVQLPTGSALTLPGTNKTSTDDDITVNPTGNPSKIKVDPTTGNVTVPADEQVVLQPGNRVVSGQATITPEGKVEITGGNAITLPGKNDQDSKDDITVTPDADTKVSMDANGGIKVPENGTVTLPNGTKVTGPATIDRNGNIAVQGGAITVPDQGGNAVPVKPTDGSSVAVDKDGKVTVGADGAMLPGGVQATHTTIAPNGEITLDASNPNSTLTLPGEPGANQPIEVTHGSGDKLKVDADGNVTVPATSTAVIDPNTVVSGEAIITPTGEVQAKPGSAITLPGATDATDDDVTVTPDAGTNLTVKPNGDVTVPEGGTVTLPGGTKVTGPATIDKNGNIAVQGNGAITVPDQGGNAVPVKPTNGSSVAVDKDGNITVSADKEATLPGDIKVTDATISPDGEVELGNDGVLTLPGAPGANQPIEVTHGSGDNLKVDTDGNVTVPTDGTAVIAPNTVVTGEAIITPTGEVQAKPGSAITLPGATDTTGDEVTVTPDAGTNVTIKPNGDVTVPEGGNATLSNGTKVSGEATIKPDGNVAVKDDGKITLPGASGNNPVVVEPVGTDNVTMAPDGTVTVPGADDKVLIDGKTEVSGAATINPDGTVAVQPNGQITLPGTNNAAGGDDVKVTVNGDQPVSIDAGGNLIVPEGGKVKVDPDTEVTGAATIKPDGTIEVGSNGQIALPGADNTDPGDDIKVKPADGSTVTMDPNSGTITVPATNKATLDPNMQVTGPAVIDKNGNVQLPTGSALTLPGTNKTSTDDDITVNPTGNPSKIKVDPTTGEVTVPAGEQVVLQPGNRVVSGQATITPEGKVEITGGNAITLPGTSEDSEDDITVTPDADTKVSMDANGGIKVPENGTVTLPNGTKVTGPATIDRNGNIAVQGNGAITVPDQGGNAVPVKPTDGSSVAVDKDGNITVPVDSEATLPGDIKVTDATISPDGEVELGNDGVLTLPGAPSANQPIEVTHGSGDNLKVDTDGNITVPTGGTAVIAPNTVVTGEAIITPTGEVQAKPGSAITLPGATDATGDEVTVTPDADTKVTVKPSGDVLIPEGGNATLSNGSKVSGQATIKPDGSVAVQGNGEITLPGVGGNNPVSVKPVGTDNVIIAPDGTVTVPTTSDKVLIGGKTEVSGEATINSDGSVTVKPNGQVVLPGKNGVAGGGDDVKVTPDATTNLTVDADGNIIVPEGGKVKVDPNTEVTGKAIIKPNGDIAVQENGKITLPTTGNSGTGGGTGDGTGTGGGTGGDTGAGGGTTTTPPAMTITPDASTNVNIDLNTGNVIVPTGGTVTVSVNMKVFGYAVIAPSGDITVQDQGKIMLPGQDESADSDDDIEVNLVGNTSVTMDPESGYITVPEGGTVTMGSNNTPVKGPAIIKPNGTVVKPSTGSTMVGKGNKYPPAVQQTDNGKVLVSPSLAVSGETVKVTLTPDEGYTVGSVTVTAADGTEVVVKDNGDGTWSYTQPNSKVTVAVTYKSIQGGTSTYDQCTRGEDCPLFGFVDVDRQLWYHEGIHYAFENGLMNGKSTTHFAPNDNTTRGQIVTILWRLEGSPKAGENTFSDVSSAMYYADAVAWAASNGVVTGYDSEHFGPEDNITREQMAAILWRYAKYKGISVEASADLSKFVDQSEISSYAVQALSWANATELVTGESDSLLNPIGGATRAQVATILMRFCTKVIAQ